MKTLGILIIIMAGTIYFKFPPSEHIFMTYLFIFLCSLGGGLLGAGLGKTLSE